MRFSNLYAGKRVFVTGHTGFKGSWLSAWLHVLGADVTGYALPPEYPGSHFEQLGLDRRIRHIEGDIRDASSLRRALCGARPQFVFHLAAQPLVRRSYAEPKLTFDTNIGGSVNLLEAVRDCDQVRALIYVTSDKCYRNRESREGYRETDVLGGHDPYSASKACAELVLESYQASFFSAPGSVMAASVRAGNAIGGGDFAEDRIVPDCIRALASGRPIPVRNPRAIRPWQHVLEPLSGYLALASRLHSGDDFRGAWNFGPARDSHRSVSELVDTIIDFWGAGSKEQASSGASLQETSTLYLNCDKSERELGWRPMFSFTEAVRRTVDWYRQSAAGADAWELTTAQIDEYVPAAAAHHA